MAVYDADGNELFTVYDADGNILDYAYDADGNVIYVRYTPVLTLLHSVPMSTIGAGTLTPQGMAVYGNYIFQFFTGDNKMRVFNKITYAKVAEYSATDIKHANTMQFGDVVQDNGFPLLYVSEWGDSGTEDSKTIDVLKIDLTGYTKVDSFTLPSSAGYHPSFVGDWQSDVGYSVGFANSLATSETQPNVITKYDLTDMSILEQYELPYMGVLNGWDYYDGKLIYCGNGWNTPTAIFSFIDVNTHEVTPYTFEKTTNEEFEGYAVDGNSLLISNWIYDADDNNTLKYRIFSMNLN